MSSTEMTLDALCAAMLASFVRANRLLAAMPLPAEALSGGPGWSDSGDGPIPWQQFYAQRRLALASAELLMACYVRRTTRAGLAILSTQPPPWWQRLGRAPLALQLQLAVADGACTSQFAATTGRPAWRGARAGAALRLTLSPQQQAQLAALRQQSRAARRRSRWLPRLLHWLRRWLTGTVTN